MVQPSFLQLDQQASEDYFVWAPIVNSTGAPPPALHGVTGALDADRMAVWFRGHLDVTSLPSNPKQSSLMDEWRMDVNKKSAFSRIDLASSRCSKK